MNLELNFDYLNEISGGDEEFINDILETFMEEMPKDIENMINAISNNDIQLLGKMAHKTKATLHLLGLEELKNLALNIEQTVKNNPENTNIIEWSGQFIKHMDSVYPKVKALL